MSWSCPSLFIIVAVWSVTQQACHGCYFPGKFEHSIVNEDKKADKDGRYSIGTEITYSCESGYELLSTQRRKCKENGNWTGVVPICARNVALMAATINASYKVISTPEHINDKKTDVCSACYLKLTDIFAATECQWWMHLPYNMTVSAIKIWYKLPIHTTAESAFEIHFKNYSSADRRMIYSSKDTKPTVQENGLKNINWEAEKRYFLTTDEISIRFSRRFYYFGNASLCEVLVYSSTETADELCSDDISFPDDQFKAISYSNRCFYIDISETKTDFEGVSESCTARKAEIATINKGFFTYFKSVLLKLKITNITLWISESSFVNNTNTKKCWTGCCPTLATTDLTAGIPDGCNLKYNYICERGVQQCGTPDQNEMTQMSFESKTRVAYSCPKRFQLVGDRQRECVNGRWTGSAPDCKFVGAFHECYHPGTPQHTVMFANPQVDEFGRYRVGTEVTFQCERGYEMVFSEARKCQQFGSWSGVEPICAVNVARKAIKVSTQIDDIHAVANINDGFYSMCSTFQKTKYRVLSWWIDLPETVNLTAIKVAFVEQEDFINDYQVKYPASTSTTGQPLNFENTMAWREIIFGKEISVIVGFLDKTKIVSTTAISVVVEKPSANLNGSLCEVGIYSSSEASDDLCNDTTTFNKFLATTYNGRCFYVATSRITYVNFEDAEKACIGKNARIAELDANAFDYLNTFMVRSGYTRTIRWVSKKSAYIYTNSEKWKTGDCPALTVERRYSKPYSCKEKYVYICEKELTKCGIPDRNEITEMKWDESGPTVTYSCPKGFKLIGSEKRDCVAGKWTGSAPVCEVSCELPEPDRNENTKMERISKTKVSYSCPEGSKLIGNQQRECVLGQWTGSAPLCQVECGLPDQNNITEMEWINETKINYSCPEGFKLIGNEQRDCVEGMWTGSAPSCEANGKQGETDSSAGDKNCSTPHIPEGSVIVLCNDTTGLWIQIVCDWGLFLNDAESDIRQCPPGGNWSGSFDVCEVHPEHEITALFAESDYSELISIGVDVVIFVVVSNAVIWLGVWLIIYFYDL